MIPHNAKSRRCPCCDRPFASLERLSTHLGIKAPTFRKRVQRWGLRVVSRQARLSAVSAEKLNRQEFQSTKQTEPVEMKKIVDVKEGGFESLLGEHVLVMCANYFYYGLLTGVNKLFIELTDAKIVYETGKWDAANWADAQSLPSKVWYVRIPFIESYSAVKK